MTAPDQCCSNSESSCQGGAVTRCPLVGFVLYGQFCMRRRNFIALLGGAAVAWPARAQQAPTPRIGYLSGRSPQAEAPLLAAVRRGLAEAGFVENQNVAIEFRFSEGRDDQLPSLAADLVGLNVAVFVTTDYPFGGGGQIVRRSNRSNRQTAECMRGGPSRRNLSHLRFHVCLDYTKQHD